MLRQFTILLAVATTAVLAQSNTVGSSTSTSTSTSPDGVATHVVKVGFPIGQHAFDPLNTVAKVGDKIFFEMYPQNHSVVRMDPVSPCIPYDLAGHPKGDLWWSGFYSIDSASQPGIFPFTVNTADPIWFYCSAPDSCINFQMVGAINAKNPDTDIAAVKKGAAKANFMLSPGESIPNESGSSGSTSTGNTPANNNASTGGSKSNSLSTGAIVGIVVGAIGAFALVGLLFFLVGRKKTGLKASNGSDSEVADKPVVTEHPPMYQDHPAYDPQYSTVPASPHPTWSAKPGYANPVLPSAMTNDDHSHRFSELPSQNYDPIEM